MSVDWPTILRDRARELRERANSMPGTAGATYALKIAEELGRLCNMHAPKAKHGRDSAEGPSGFVQREPERVTLERRAKRRERDQPCGQTSSSSPESQASGISSVVSPAGTLPNASVAEAIARGVREREAARSWPGKNAASGLTPSEALPDHYHPEPGYMRGCSKPECAAPSSSATPFDDLVAAYAEVRRETAEACAEACFAELASYDGGTHPYFKRAVMACIERIRALPFTRKAGEP